MKRFSLSIIGMGTVGIFLTGCVLVTTDPCCDDCTATGYTKDCTTTYKRIDPRYTDCVSKKIDTKQEREKLWMHPNAKKITVTGEGVAPQNTISPAQALALAKRAAIADAYRQLGGKLYGVRINATDTVKDAAIRDSRIETQVNALIKDANVVDTSYKNGLYEVTMELNLDKNTWQRIFSY